MVDVDLVVECCLDQLEVCIDLHLTSAVVRETPDGVRDLPNSSELPSSTT